ncbi:hypothetical protein ABPG73_022408 [Tetrahymena malaccensis]
MNRKAINLALIWLNLSIQVVFNQVFKDISNTCQFTGYFYDSSSGKCDSCIQNCNNCTNKNECIQCSFQYFLDAKQNCQSQCPQGYYPDQIDLTCIKCPDNNCLDCDNYGQCKKCQENYKLSEQNVCLIDQCLQNEGVYNTQTGYCSLDCAFDNQIEQINCTNLLVYKDFVLIEQVDNKKFYVMEQENTFIVVISDSLVVYKWDNDIKLEDILKVDNNKFLRFMNMFIKETAEEILIIDLTKQYKNLSVQADLINIIGEKKEQLIYGVYNGQSLFEVYNKKLEQIFKVKGVELNMFNLQVINVNQQYWYLASTYQGIYIFSQNGEIIIEQPVHHLNNLNSYQDILVLYSDSIKITFFQIDIIGKRLKTINEIQNPLINNDFPFINQYLKVFGARNTTNLVLYDLMSGFIQQTFPLDQDFQQIFSDKINNVINLYISKYRIIFLFYRQNFMCKILVGLFNPIIYHQKVKQLGLKQYQIILKGVSDTNGFMIACNVDLRELKSSSTILQESKKIQIIQESDRDGFKNCFIQQSEQRDTRKIKYQILYKSSQSIKVFDICNENLFNERTLIEFKAQTLNKKHSDIVLTLKNNNFVNDKFFNVKISSSNVFLDFANHQDISFNPENKLIKFQLSQLNITTNQNTHYLHFNSIKSIIFNDINMLNLNWQSHFIMLDNAVLTLQNINLNNLNITLFLTFMQISNVDQLFINNMTISNCQFTQQLFEMTNVKEITIKNLKIIDSTFEKNIISAEQTKFLNIQGLDIIYSNKEKREEQIQNISILFLTNVFSIKLENIKIINTQFIQLLSYSQVQELQKSFTIKNLTVDDYYQNQPLLSIIFSDVVILNIIKLNNILLENTNIFEVFKTTNFILQKLEATNIINSLYQTVDTINIKEEYQQPNQCLQMQLTCLMWDQLIYFPIHNRTKKLTSYSTDNFICKMLQYKKQNTKTHVNNIESKYHIIQVSVRDKFEIEQSSFKKVDLENESIINVLQTQVVGIKQTTFENIHVSKINCGVVCINLADQIQIIESDFIDIQNQEAQDVTVLHKNGSGALFITDSFQVLVAESRFIKCQNYFYGGAVYLESNIEVNFFNSTFTQNGAILNSGGAVFSKQNQISFQNCTFESNYANNEKGGAIFSQDSMLEITQCKIFNNKALIGGGIYVDLGSFIGIKQSSIINNAGLFYGDNLASIPKSIKRVEQSNNTKTDYILINNFQSGNYTKDIVYVNFFDSEGRMLDFIAIKNYIAKNKNTVSKQVESEYLSYFLKIQNDQEDEILISSGIQLLFDDQTGMFKFNINAAYKSQKRHVLKIVSNINNLNITLIINFRDCIIGEIKQNRHGFIFCDECSQGTYSLVNPNAEGISQCKTCPAEAQYCRGNQIILRDGYWRETKTSDQIFECVFEGCSEVNGNEFGCIQGFIGPMCQSCDNYGENWDNLYGVKGTYCYRCSNFVEVYIYLAIAIVVYILYIHFSLRSQIDEKSKLIKLNYLRKMNILFLSKSRQKGQDSAVLTKIFLNYLQIFSTSFDFFQRIPKIFESAIDIGGDPTDITVTSYDCLFKLSWIYPVWLNRILIQFFQIFVTFCLILAIQKCFSQRKQKKIYITIYLVFIYLFYYPSIAKFLISLVFCEQIGSHSYLKNDYKQQCYSEQHKIYSAILIYPLLIIWTVIIPSLLFLKMRKSKQQGKDQNISYILSYYILQQGFRTQYYYWEIVRMSKKFLIMIVINLSINDTNQRLIIAIICQIYFTLINKLNPISSLAYSRCERILIQVLIISLMLQCILYSSENMKYLQTIAIIFFFLINLFGVAQLARAYLKLKQQKPPKIILKMSQYLTKYEFFKNYFKKQRVPLLRISQLWQKVYKNRQNLISITQTKINTLNRITSSNYIESIKNIRNLDQIRQLQPITSKQRLNQDEVIQFSSINMEDS